MPLCSFFIGIGFSRVFFESPQSSPPSPVVASDADDANLTTVSPEAETMPQLADNPISTSTTLLEPPPVDSTLNSEPETEPQTGLSDEDVLSDTQQRIADEFKVPRVLRKRTSFWFDVYTKYDSSQNIIHHADYPWILFKIVNADAIYKSPGNRWVNYHRGKRFIEREKKSVIATLKKLSLRKNFNNLSSSEVKFVGLLKDIPGRRSLVFAHAAESVRIQLGQKDFYEKGLSSSSKYLTKMEEIFAKYNLPVELTRLPLVESSFNLKAISKVGASGIWQFMPSTGRTKKLRIDGDIDERNSPIKATEAAAKLMRENFRILKSWPLAITAYNHGPGGLIKAVKRTGSRELSKIINAYDGHNFGFASSNFYTEFLAALHAEKYQNEIFGSVHKSAPLLFDRVRLERPIRALVVARIANMTTEELHLYNPDLGRTSISKNATLPQGYDLHVPPGRRRLFKATLTDALTSRTKKRYSKKNQLTKTQDVSSKKKESSDTNRTKSTTIDRENLISVHFSSESKDLALSKSQDLKEMIVLTEKGDSAKDSIKMRKKPIRIDLDENDIAKTLTAHPEVSNNY